MKSNGFAMQCFRNQLYMYRSSISVISSTSYKEKRSFDKPGFCVHFLFRCLSENVKQKQWLNRKSIFWVNKTELGGCFSAWKSFCWSFCVHCTGITVSSTLCWDHKMRYTSRTLENDVRMKASFLRDPQLTVALFKKLSEEALWMSSSNLLAWCYF